MAVVGLASLALSATPALAVHELVMELDGNTSVQSGNPAYDWESLFQRDATTGDIADKGALPNDLLARGHIADYVLPERTTFATGSKDTLNIGATASKAAGWQCGKSNNLGAKDDLVNVYTAAYRNSANDHLILYFGAEKSSNLGDNNVGIWFLQDSSVGCIVPTNGANTSFSGHHVAGDVLLTAAFTNGGTVANVEARTWVAGADNGGEGLLSAPDSGFLCGTSTNDAACAITNTPSNNPTTGDINPPWNHPVKTAGTDGVSLASQEFYEGGVDVTQLQIDANNGSADPCITTFLADTRSSQSPTATLFDYAYGSFPVCKPATTLTSAVSASTIHSGDSVTWTVTEANTGTSPISNVTVTDQTAGPCTFVGTPQAAPNAAYNIGDTDRDGALDASPAETWTFTCTKANITTTTTLRAFGSGTDTISSKSVTGDPSKCTFDDSVTPPTGTPKAGFAATTVCDPNERANSVVTVIHPATTMVVGAGGASAATASANPIHATDNVTYTFYEKNDGDVVLTSPTVSTDDANCALATQTKKVDDLATSGVNEALYNVGDADNDLKLDVGEQWTFTCQTSYAQAGPKTIVATGHGLDPLLYDVTLYTSSSGGATVDCTAGALTTSPKQLCDLQERTSVSITVINPSTYLRETATASVTFRYFETNDGDSAIATPTVDSSCAGAGAHANPIYKANTTINIGDLDNDGQIDGTDTTSETWQFYCIKKVTISSGNTVTYTDSSTGHGTDAAGSVVDNTTDSQEADSSTVTLTDNVPNGTP